MPARVKKNKDVSERRRQEKILIGSRGQIPNPPKNTHLVEGTESINKMYIWTITNWKNNLPDNVSRRSGLRFRYDKTVHPEVKRACTEFAIWLRSQYYFPLRMPVYVKNKKTVLTKDGENVVGLFFEPFSYKDEPYIKIAVGDYETLEVKWGKDNALASILLTLAHEITHYYQWLNNIQITSSSRERQANRCAKYIIDEYSLTREHP